MPVYMTQPYSIHAPGSHKNGVTRRFKRLPLPEVGTEFIPPENVHLNQEGGVPVECPAGSLVLIHHSVSNGTWCIGLCTWDITLV